MLEEKDSNSHTESMRKNESKNLFLTNPVKIGNFKIEKELSSGGGGTVYLAYDESMKRRVALKVLHPSLGITTTAQTRFAREAWIAGQLEHSNIIKVYSRGEENQLNYIALEFAEHGSLSDYIKLQREQSAKSKVSSVTANREHFKSVITKFVDLANGLEYIHSKGFIHRDIKPHNILLAGESRQFKLTDFGIAHAADMTRMTHKGDFIGTVHYMSPEQIAAHRTVIDNRTDIYSLGVTLYEALTLSLPFEADSEEKLISEIISGHSIPARRRLSSIPKDLETILLKATHHDASRRYQSAKDFADDLKRFLELKPIIARPDSIFYKAAKTFSLKKRANQIVLAAVLIVMAGGVIVSNIQQNKYDKERILVSLKRAVETKTSPFEFEPDWARLSKKLYEHVKKGQVDSTMIWFLRTVSITDFYYENYLLAENMLLAGGIKSLKIFEKDIVKDDTEFTSFAFMDFGINHNLIDFQEFRLFNFFKRHERSLLTAQSLGSRALKERTPGELTFIVKTVSTHYFGVNFYDTSSGFIGNYVGTGKKVLYCGDSILQLSGADAYKSEIKDMIILDKELLTPAQPIFVDTVLDSVSVFCFEKWPDNFPKATYIAELSDSVFNAARIDKIEIIKRIEHIGKELVNIRIIGVFADRINEFPIAADLVLFSHMNNDTLLRGQLVRGLNRIEIRFGKSRFKNSTRLEIPERKNHVAEFFDIDFDSDLFDRLVKADIVYASLHLIPSIEAARNFGHFTKYWNDTLLYNITFQAIDSTKSN